MLCAMMRTETVLSDLSFVMLFNGFRSRISKHDKYYTDTIDTVRSLHVYGQSDEVIPLGKLTPNYHHRIIIIEKYIMNYE